MNENKVGDALYYLRTEKGVSRDQLYQGLCTKSNYCLYEQGGRLPDRLLLNALLQRLGRNPDKLATALSAEEYAYFQWKKQVLAAMGHEDMDVLQRILEKPAEIMASARNLQQQFLSQTRAIVAERMEQDIGKCILLLEQAVELTMPGITERGIDKYLVSTEEMKILLDLSEALGKGGREKEAGRLLHEIVVYVEHNYSDYESKIIIHPKAVKQLAPMLLQGRKYMEGLLLCKKAIDLLCIQGVLYDLAELMEYYLRFSEHFPETEEAARYRKQLQALREVYRKNGAELYLNENVALSYSNRETYLIDEVIKRGRMVKAYTQEELSERVEVSWETISRVENGKRAPSAKNFRAMMETLDTGLDYYNGELDTTDFLLLEKKQELERAISLKRWEEANELLQYLRSRLDMDRPRNQRILRAEENCILFNMGKLDRETFLKECEIAMDCAGERWREEGFWHQFLTRYKVRVLNYIAVLYHIGGQTEQSIFILEHMLEQLVSSRVELADRYKSSMTAIDNLSSYYGEMGRLDDCLEMCDMGIDLCMDSGRGIRLGGLLGTKAEALDIKAGKITEKSKCYLKQAYYLSDLMSVHSVTAYLDNYYRTHYKIDVIWY